MEAKTAKRAKITSKPSKTKKLYTITEAATEIGVPRPALRGWVQAGDIRSVKSGRKFYITLNAVDEFINGTGTARS